MATVQHPAIQFNNYAVSLIEAGNNHDAIAALTKALKSSKENLIFDDSEGHDLSNGNASLDDCMRRGPMFEKEAGNTTDGTKEASFLYRQAIHIPDSIVSSMKTSAMIVFNMALSHHLLAMECGTFMKGKLQKAIKLYNLASNLQSEIKNESNLLFTMATINNLGLAYQSLQDYVTAARFFEHVLMTPMFLNDPDFAKLSKLDAFLETACRHVFKRTTAAAA